MLTVQIGYFPRDNRCLRLASNNKLGIPVYVAHAEVI